MKNNHIITIDGPSASGKGSLAKALAKELSFILLDSGLLYRAYSYCFEQSHNHSAAKSLFLNLRINSIDHEMHVFENNTDITSILRHENIAKSASQLSSLKETRDNLISFQRDLASDNGLVADGRDMGSVVFPNANLKFFLDAAPEVRAKRRHLELQKRGQEVNIHDLINDIVERDKKDRTRELSPLIKTEDSILLDSTNLDQESILDEALQHIKERNIL